MNLTSSIFPLLVFMNEISWVQSPHKYNLFLRFLPAFVFHFQLVQKQSVGSSFAPSKFEAVVSSDDALERRRRRRTRSRVHSNRLTPRSAADGVYRLHPAFVRSLGLQISQTEMKMRKKLKEKRCWRKKEKKWRKCGGKTDEEENNKPDRATMRPDCVLAWSEIRAHCVRHMDAQT